MTPDAPSSPVAKDSAGTSPGASRVRDAGAAAAAPAAAFDWHPFAAGLRRFVARRVPERDAEDVAQDVLLRLHQSASTLRDAGRAEAWVYGVARRTIADYYRASGGRAPGAASGEVDPGELPDPDAPAARGFGSFRGDHDVHEEVLSWLRPTAEELPNGYREALLLADFEGRSQREVAAELGLSLSGAKSRVQRARKMLGERLLDCCELALGPDGRVEDFKRRDPCDC